jgi:hypothetical protein
MTLGEVLSWPFQLPSPFSWICHLQGGCIWTALGDEVRSLLLWGSPQSHFYASNWVCELASLMRGISGSPLARDLKPDFYYFLEA